MKILFVCQYFFRIIQSIPSPKAEPFKQWLAQVGYERVTTEVSRKEKPEGLARVLWFKMRRWWFNRWKHPLVYDEWLLPMFLTLAWSKVRRVRTIGD